MKKNNTFRQGAMALIVAGLIASCTENDAPTVEVPPVEDAFMEIQGGGASFPNSVFVNLSSELQNTVRRDTWDLAFYTGSEFKVFINGTTGAMAYGTEVGDFQDLEIEYVEKLKAEGTLVLDFNNMNSILYVDDPKNPLTNGTALGTVASSESEARVFVYERGNSGADEKPWKKIKVFRSGDRYVIQHADIDSEDYTTVEITKDTDFNFVYFSFESGKVEVEPKKHDWDFVWTAGTSSTPFPQAVNGTLGYFFQDLVYHNIYGGVQAAVVMESEISYDEFSDANVNGLTFGSDDRLIIGSSWRSGGGPNSGPAIREDRYYVIRDKNENVYKLRFLSLTSGGERGRPSLEYSLVK